MKNLLIVLIIGLAIGVGVWWAKSRNAEEDTLQLIEWVDRQVPPEVRTRLETNIGEFTARIGGDRDITDLDLWIELGNVKNILGDLEGARDAYRTAAELNPLGYIAQGNLGDVLAEMGDLAGAEAAYERAVNLSGGLAVYFEKSARFLEIYFPERTADYERLLLAAVAAAGQRPEFIARLAAFYEAQGRLEEARSHLEVLVALVPDNEAARRDLERVKQKIAEQ